MGFFSKLFSAKAPEAKMRSALAADYDPASLPIPEDEKQFYLPDEYYPLKSHEGTMSFIPALLGFCIH